MTTTASPDTTATPADELLHVDPGVLVIGENIRVDARVDAKEFAASIKARGVLEVITAYRDEDGRLVVHRGQRRAVVATRVGTPSGTVPVRVVSSPANVDRIADQLTENIHRAGMHDREVRDAVHQLALCGVSAAQIVKRTALPRPTVDAAIKVTASPSARERMDTASLTLDEAAIFAEFDSDDDATQTLTEALDRRWSPLAHVAQRLRDQRAEEAALRVEVERLRAQGLPALDPRDTPASIYQLQMSNLRTADGSRVPEEDWPTTPGAAVVVVRTYARSVRRTTAQSTDHDADIDTDDAAPQVDLTGDVREPANETGDGDAENEYDDDEAWDEDEDDERGSGALDGERVLEPVWVCLDPAAAELHYVFDYDSASGGRDGDAAELTPEQAEASREAKRTERREVIANNKAWRSAETVRRAWLRDFVTRKTPPVGAEALICEALVTAPYSVVEALRHRHPRLRALFGEEEQPASLYSGADHLLARAATPKAATMLALAVVLAAWEESTDVGTWRRRSAWDTRVMLALTGWGYEASEVERLLMPHEEGPEGGTDADGAVEHNAVEGADEPREVAAAAVATGGEEAAVAATAHGEQQDRQQAAAA